MRIAQSILAGTSVVALSLFGFAASASASARSDPGPIASGTTNSVLIARSGSDNSGPGSDHDGGDDHDGSGSSGSGNSGAGNSGSGNSGPGNSGHGHNNHDNDRDENDNHNNRDSRDGRDARGDRPEVDLNVSDENLRGLLNGSLVAVDNLGRVLEVEVEREHGVRAVTVKPHGGDFRRNPGPITNISIRPASAP
jgi:hypothetical protein